MRPRVWVGVLLAVAVAVILPSPLSLATAVGLLLLVVVVRLGPGAAARAVRVEAVGSGTASVEETVRVDVTVTNPSRWPLPWAELRIVVPGGFTLAEPPPALLTVPGRGRVHVRVDLSCARRGRYVLGPAELRPGDAFGLLQPRLRGFTLGELLVLPRVVPVTRAALPARAPVPALHAPRSLLEDPAAFEGVRPYVPGDALRRVHWPATAATGTTVVKQFARAESRDTVVCLDVGQQGYGTGRFSRSGEAAVTIAASVLHHVLLGERLAAGLCLARGGSADAPLVLEPREGAAQLQRLLALLAVVQPQRDASLHGVLDALGPALGTGATLVVVTGTGPAGAPDVDLHARLVAARRQGFEVAMVVVGDARAGVDALRLRAAGIAVHLVDAEVRLRSLEL